MTCIVGILDKKDDCVWIGADSLGSNGWSKNIESNPKVFRNKSSEKIIMGGTTSFRALDLLKYDETIFPEIDIYKNIEIDHEYMVTKAIPRVIALFKDGMPSEKEEDRTANFLVGVRNRLFEIQDDFSVMESASGYMAVGSGYMTALASLDSTRNDTDIVSRIVKALEVSEERICSVQRPFIILNTKDTEVITIR